MPLSPVRSLPGTYTGLETPLSHCILTDVLFLLPPITHKSLRGENHDALLLLLACPGLPIPSQIPSLSLSALSPRLDLQSDPMHPLAHLPATAFHPTQSALPSAPHHYHLSSIRLMATTTRLIIVSSLPDFKLLLFRHCD